MMKRTTVAVALALSVVALPALACPGKNKMPDQNALIMPSDGTLIVTPKTNV